MQPGEVTNICQLSPKRNHPQQKSLSELFLKIGNGNKEKFRHPNSVRINIDNDDPT